MTRDDSGNYDESTGDPGGDLQPRDVIKCRECGGLVRRVNHQHLVSDRCKYTKPEDVRTGKAEREDLLRPDHPTTTQEYKEMYPDAPVMAPTQSKMLSEAAKDPEVRDRRQSLLRRRWRGEPMTDIVESLADKHGVAERTIWDDWRNREDWLPELFGLGNAEAVVVESLAQKKDVRERLLKIANRAETMDEHDTARKALKAVDANIDKTIEHQQNLGEVEQAATKHEVEVSGEISHEPGADLDDDTVEALDAITGGGDGGGDGGGGEGVIDADFREVDDG